MATRRRKTRSSTRRPSHTVTVSKRAIAFTHIGVSVFYFFCLIFVPDAPIFGVIQEVWQAIVGNIWLTITMGVAGVLWLLYLKKDQVIVGAVKRSVVLVVMLSTLLNGTAIDLDPLPYLQQWWYISRPIVQVLQIAFGSDPMAIQTIAIVGMLIAVGMIIYQLNVKVNLPKINVQYKWSSPSQDTSTSSTKSSPTKSIKQQWLFGWLTGSWSSRNGSKIHASSWSVHKDINSSTWSTSESAHLPHVKDFVKNKIAAKLWLSTEEPKIEKPKTAMTFGGDVPTFPLKLLTPTNHNAPQVDITFIDAKATQIINKLEEFGIKVSLQWYNIWPSVIQMMVTPASGVKISSIESHKDDMMLALKTKSLRIIAPIPGTDSVGIEIPNPHPTMIRLHELLASQEFIAATKDNATNISLGKGIDGKLVVRSLEKMPHLLVAGATGQGKSVGINDFVMSLMIQNTPDQIKFVMVDPKQVEMELYSWLPYQLCPIITDPEQALKALKWCAIEMDERYTILKNARVKNLAEYIEKTGEHMYRIVIVIDELADLMMTGKKKDVELVIARIAQKARAVGIHLILATQRPSVNVITGLIKANIPCRISFGVVSQIDSRTILDQKGAEDLLGKGDMLYLDTTMKHPIRVQAPFVDTDEIEAVATYLKQKYMNNIDESEIYHPQLMELLEQWSWSDAYADLLWWLSNDDDDALVRQAIDIIADSRRASTTHLQKKLSIGFARASRIMDILEDKGIVWPQEGSKAREVLI